MMQATSDGKNRHHYEDNKMASNIRGCICTCAGKVKVPF